MLSTIFGIACLLVGIIQTVMGYPASRITWREWRQRQREDGMITIPFRTRLQNLKPLCLMLLSAILILIGVALLIPHANVGHHTPQSAQKNQIVKTLPAVTPSSPVSLPSHIASRKKKNSIQGSDNTAVGKDHRSIKGNGNTIVGPTDAKGNTILNRGGLAIGNGAKADQSSIAIGAHANAGQQNSHDNPQTLNTGGITQNNSGGINVQQGTTGNNSPIINSPITVGEVPRRISRENAKTLVSFLSECPDKPVLQITADQDSDLPGFPTDLYNVFHEAGWTMKDRGVAQLLLFFPPGPRFHGVKVTIHGEPLKQGEFPPIAATDPLVYVGIALTKLNVPHILERQPTVPEGEIDIEFLGGLPSGGNP